MVGVVIALVLAGALFWSPSGPFADRKPPSVVSTDPPVNATGVDLSLTRIQVEFSEDMDQSPPPRGSVRLSFASCKYCGIDYVVVWASARKLQVGLETPLPSSRTVDVLLFSGDFRDRAGNPMASSHDFKFDTRPFGFEVRKDRAHREAGDYIVTGEVANLENGVMAPFLWKNGTAGAAGPVLNLRATFFDSSGVKIWNDFCLTPLLIALRPGDPLPFRCTLYDPDSKASSYKVEAVLYESLPLLWDVAPYELELKDVVGKPSAGGYNVSGNLSNTGVRKFAADGLRVVVVVYRSDGSVLDFGEFANLAAIGAGGRESFEIRVADPLGEAASQKVVASVFFP